MAGSMATEREPVTNLVGTRANPAPEPSRKRREPRGSIGEIAFRDACIIVAIAWLVVIFLAYSLREHNV
jgi:hypothetical protein